MAPAVRAVRYLVAIFFGALGALYAIQVVRDPSRPDVLGLVALVAIGGAVAFLAWPRAGSRPRPERHTTPPRAPDREG